MGVLGEPGSSFLYHAACWPTRGAWKSPISSGPAPSSCLLLKSPATIQAYWVSAPTRWPTFHILLLGVLGRNHFHFFPSHCWPVPRESSWHPVPTPVAAPGQTPEKVVQCLHLSRFLCPLGRAMLRRMDRAVFQQSPAVPPILPLGPSPLMVTTARLGRGTQLSLSILSSKATAAAGALHWASLALARSLSVEVSSSFFWRSHSMMARQLSFWTLLVLLVVGPLSPSGSFKEDTTSPTNSSIYSGPWGGDPGNLWSLYTW